MLKCLCPYDACIHIIIIHSVRFDPAIIFFRILLVRPLIVVLFDRLFLPRQTYVNFERSLFVYFIRSCSNSSTCCGTWCYFKLKFCIWIIVWEYFIILWYRDFFILFKFLCLRHFYGCIFLWIFILRLATGSKFLWISIS